MSLAYNSFEADVQQAQDAVILQFRCREQPYRPNWDEVQKFGTLASWAFLYIDYIYQNGDNNGRSMPMDNSIKWQLAANPSDQINAEARGRRGFSPRADMKPGVVFMIQQTMQDSQERLELESDGYRVVGGSYVWQGDEILRPAPDADFASILGADQARVSAKGVELLSSFKDGALNQHRGMTMSGVWNKLLGVRPPDTIQGKYVTSY